DPVHPGHPPLVRPRRRDGRLPRPPARHPVPVRDGAPGHPGERAAHAGHRLSDRALQDRRRPALRPLRRPRRRALRPAEPVRRAGLRLLPGVGRGRHLQRDGRHGHAGGTVRGGGLLLPPPGGILAVLYPVLPDPGRSNLRGDGDLPAPGAPRLRPARPALTMGMSLSVRTKLVLASLAFLLLGSLGATVLNLGLLRSWVEEGLRERAIAFAREVA